MRGFHERFHIEVDLDEAKNRFVNRIVNLLEKYFRHIEFDGIDVSIQARDEERRAIANALGVRFVWNWRFSDYVGSDFLSCLLVLEAAYQSMTQPSKQGELSELIERAISQSEVALGVSWKDGIFRRSGAKLLDEELVNEPLEWLSDPKYKSVLAPFKKGVKDFLESSKYPDRLVDTVRDMYESIEKMARIVTGNNKNLKANAEQFVSKLGLSANYSKMLKNFTEYACEFRHAVEEGKERELPKPKEVEAFIYSTGLYIRLAIQSLA